MEKEKLAKTLSIFIPTRRGWLAIANGFAIAVIIPLLIPFYDPSGVFLPKVIIAALMAVSTGVICLRCLHRGRGIDRLAAFLTAALAAWMFYRFIHSIDYYAYGAAPH
jgi:hypothetical protein